MKNTPAIVTAVRKTKNIPKRDVLLLYFLFNESAEQAKAKTEIILFDTDLINFTDEDFICGEAKINESCEGTFEKAEFEAGAIRASMIGRELQGDYYRSDFQASSQPEVVIFSL